MRRHSTTLAVFVGHPVTHGLLCCVLASVMTAALPSPVYAATAAEMRKAEALATEAKVFFGSKLYKDAALQFMEAFALSGRPNLVYNAARAYQEGGYPKKSVALFRYYLSRSGVDAAGKKAARGHMEAQEARLAAARKAEQAKRAAAAKAAKTAKATQRARDATKSSAQPANPGRTQPKRDEATRRSAAAQRLAEVKRELHTWWAGASATVVVISGVAYGVALSQSSEMSASDVFDEVTRDRYLANRDSARVWRGFAVGAGVIGLGLVGWTALQWWTGVKPAKGATNLWLAPTVSAERSGFVAGMRF